MEVYNINFNDVIHSLFNKIGDAMPKAGGTFTGNAIATTTTDEATAMLRNVVVVEADTDLATLSVPAGTIIMIRKPGES
jgi:hypothetical protein